MPASEVKNSEQVKHTPGPRTRSHRQGYRKRFRKGDSMKPRVIAILFIAVLVLLSVVWGRTAKPIKHPYSIQNPGAAPLEERSGAPDMPLCCPWEPCPDYPNSAKFNPTKGLGGLEALPAIVALMPTVGWKQKAHPIRVAKLNPVNPQVSHPARRRTDKEMAA